MCFCHKELRSLRKQQKEEEEEAEKQYAGYRLNEFHLFTFGGKCLRIMYLHMPIHDGVRIQVKSAC